MSVVPRVSAYLDKAHVHYELLKHARSFNSLSSAIASNIPLTQVVKAVILEDHESRKLMAILPASHKINLSTLSEELNRQLHLMKEEDVFELFKDCEHGAVPPVAQAYHMDRVYDECLLEQPELYLEAGDHAYLMQLKKDGFIQLMDDAKCLHFSNQVFD
ncbi:YbaK/EbsC family protein [Photobacterium sp.]|uniref:aminoacyl-tRNA deacylase n=1 Tax=Photobacterium sp. TaxID=660 RepID=UPI00299F31FB|nr:YbaK/EbsC family protein [Photobacterium sp.]MDX1300723.1 YbaK/EbsC family protein [Photobacterium sp.]